MAVAPLTSQRLLLVSRCGVDWVATLWDGNHDGPTNMARDAALLSQVEAGVPWAARVYGWTAPWITLGVSQDPTRDLRPACPVPACRRTTGGRAVLHGHDLTLGLAVSLTALAEPGEDPASLERSLRRVYRRVIDPLVVALNRAGAAVALGEDLRRHGAGSARASQDCFAAISANDVVHRATGKKVGGCALRVTRAGALLQGSIPVGPPVVPPAECFWSSARVEPTPLERDAFVEAWGNALAEAWGVPSVD